MPSGIASILRSALLACVKAAAILYVGIIAIACIRLGTFSKLPSLAMLAVPWTLKIFAVLILGAAVYVAVILLITTRNIRGTDFTLMSFMSLTVEERHTLMKSWRRGPYRDA